MTELDDVLVLVDAAETRLASRRMAGKNHALQTAGAAAYMYLRANGPAIKSALEDARRYRYLRDRCKREWESDMPHNKGAPSLDIDFSAAGHDLDAAIDAMAAGGGECWCQRCRPITLADMRFVVCPDCGNKRCPRANDHRHDCTGSNEPGQPGSAYPAQPEPPQ